jgi:hypothetical protein
MYGKFPVGGGAPIRLTFNGGEAPLESPDGQWVYYMKTGTDSLWRCSTEGGREEPVLNTREINSFAVVPGGVYYLYKEGPQRFSLDFLRVSTHTISHIAVVPGPVGLGLTVSPDESEILYTKVQPGSEMMLVESFR